MAGLDSSLVFTVRRCKPELVAPAKPTPHEFKELSDIDNQVGLRLQMPIILFYRNDPSMNGKDPARVIREALAQTLVFYYPFAGRLREAPGGKPVVDCTGEGVLFIEADSEVTLQQFGNPLQPPFPCFEELLFDVPGSSGILNCPLLLIQVTRLKCGGFIFALRLNHTVSDAAGLGQFLMAMSELARGAPSPSIPPVWQRHLLNARDPPRVTCPHPHLEYVDAVDIKSTAVPHVDMNHRCIFFGPAEESALRRLVPFHLSQCSMFVVLTACLWRCRTVALQIDPSEQVGVLFPVNTRAKFDPPLPSGYYGNAFAPTAAITTAGKLCENPIGYALKLVETAKNDVTEEYMRSFTDLTVIKGRPRFTLVLPYHVSDATRAGFREIDFGWGKAAYGGVPKGVVDPTPGAVSFYIPAKDSNGEHGILVTIGLAAPAMERFVKELDCLLIKEPTSGQRKYVPRL